MMELRYFMVKSRGRPQDLDVQQERKAKLIEAAHRLLTQKSFRSITIREIAAEAGMQSAMISYYFGNKESLFIAMLEDLSKRQFSTLSEAVQSEEPLKGFIYTFLGYLKDNNIMGRFLIDDVVRQPGPLGERFIELFPKQMEAFLPVLIKREQDAGRIRTDVNPRWAAFSLMNLLLMPFFAEPVRERAWNISHQDVSSEQWANHIYQMFIQGVSVNKVEK